MLTIERFSALRTAFAFNVYIPIIILMHSIIALKCKTHKTRVTKQGKKK